MPRWLVIESNLRDLSKKIQKFIDHGLCIPTEYIVQYNQLIEEQKNLQKN